MVYHPKQKSSLVAASILVLICNAISGCCTISTVDNQQASSSKQHDHSEVTDKFQNGLFMVHRAYSQKNYNDRLKLSKSYIKYQLKTLFTGDLSIIDFNINIKEHILRCDNLTLLDTALYSDFECQPIESYLPNDIDSGASPSSSSKATSNIAEYVKRTTIKIKPKCIGDFHSKIEYVLYPLKNEHTELKIGSILEENNLTSPLNFATPINLGYQVELNFFTNPKSENTKYLTCLGQMYLSVNASKPIPSARNPNETYPEILHNYEDLFTAAVENGYLLSVRNSSCYQPTGPINFFKFETNFDVAHKNDFPYFTLKHSSWLEPFRAMFDYKAFINQTKTSEDSYNTTTLIDSSSTLLNMLNFELNQTNSNSLSGGFSEEMISIGRRFAMRIWAIKNETMFLKQVKLYLFDLDQFKTSPEKYHNVYHSGICGVEDVLSDDDVLFYCKLRRDIANSLYRVPISPLWRANETEKIETIRSDL